MNLAPTLPDTEAPLDAPRSAVLAETTWLVALSLLSPAAGLAVEMALAWRFGTSAVVDAYRVAVLLVLFGQQLFVTSILPFVIVPVLAEYHAQGKMAEAWASIDAMARLLLVFGCLIASALFVSADPATSFLAPGLHGEGRATAVFFVRWCGLAFVPLCWSGVACGILYAHGAFRVAPVAQLASNMIVLVAIVALGKRLGANGVVIGVVLGAIASAGIYVVSLSRVRREFAPKGRAIAIDGRALGKFARLAGPLLAGIVVGQASGAVVTRALSRLAAGSLAAFGYSWKLGQVVLLAPGALSTVLFPKFSASWHSNARGDFTASSVRALRAILFVTLPATCISFALRDPLVKLLLERGAFSATAGRTTAALFGMLILGAPGNAMTTYIDRLFYATQETSIPVFVDIGSSLLPLLIVPALALRLGVLGVAAAYMLLPWLTAGVLMALFQSRHKHAGFPLGELRGFFLRTTILAVVSAWLGTRLPAICGTSSAVTCLAGTVSAAGLFLFAARAAGVPEAVQCGARFARLVRSYKG